MKKTVASLVLAFLLVASSFAAADPIDTGTGYLDPSNLRYQGFVYDLETGAPIEGVCVYAGPVGCPDPAIRTDARGHWSIDFPKGPLKWDFHFALQGYYDATILDSGTRSVVVLVPTTGYESGSTGVSIPVVSR